MGAKWVLDSTKSYQIESVMYWWLNSCSVLTKIYKRHHSCTSCSAIKV